MSATCEHEHEQDTDEVAKALALESAFAESEKLTRDFFARLERERQEREAQECVAI